MKLFDKNKNVEHKTILRKNIINFIYNLIKHRQTKKKHIKEGNKGPIY